MRVSILPIGFVGLFLTITELLVLVTGLRGTTCDHGRDLSPVSLTRDIIRGSYKHPAWDVPWHKEATLNVGDAA
jgi:hypothetical protein